MAQLPLDPIYSRALILASQFNCLEEMLITVAMLSVESIFYAPREKLEEVYCMEIATSNVLVIIFSLIYSWEMIWLWLNEYLMLFLISHMISNASKW